MSLNPYRFQGWQCPVCRRVYSPIVMTCTACAPGHVSRDTNQLTKHAITGFPCGDESCRACYPEDEGESR